MKSIFSLNLRANEKSDAIFLNNLKRNSLSCGKLLFLNLQNGRYATLENTDLNEQAFETLVPMNQRFSNRKPKQLIVSPQDESYGPKICKEYSSFLPKGYKVNQFLIENTWFVYFDDNNS